MSFIFRFFKQSKLLPFIAQQNVSNNITSNRVLPLFIAVLATVLIHLHDNGLSGWSSYFLALIQVSIELSPLFICKYLSLKATGKKQLIWWLIGFIALPVIGVFLVHNFPPLLNWSISSGTTLGIIIAIELLSVVNNWLVKKTQSIRKIKLSLDNMIMAILVVISFIVAMLLNSSEAPLLNQPIPILFDLKRNALHVGSLLGYWLQVFMLYGCLFVIHLVNHHVLVKKVLSQHGVFTYLWTTTLFLLVCYPLLAQFALWLPMNDVPEPFVGSTNHNPFDFWNIYLGAIVILVSTPVIMALKLQKDHLQLSELQQEKLHTELKWLQQQINPHFLFNTLNNLYSLCLSKSAQAPDAILQLANLLRFVVYKGSNNLVSVKDEIEYLKDYLSLQQLRVINKCKFDININDENILGLNICPLLLVNFLENAIKHGVEPSSEQSWLQVSFMVSNDTLYFVCENSVSVHNARESSQSGIGLKNVERRLALTYPDKHRLNYQVGESTYKVELSINLSATK